MALKTKTIPSLTNEQGFEAKDIVSKVAGVNFDYKGMSLTIHWEMFPSTFEEGMQPITKYQTLSFLDEKGNPAISQEQFGLLLAVSDAIHVLAEDHAFIGTKEGLVSFKDLKAVTAEV